MNLKESYRYANYLDELLSAAYVYLLDKGFVTTTKQKHLRSKTNSGAEDEIIEIQKSYDVDFTPNNIIDFVVRIIDEKEKLFLAIANAKATVEINIDNAIAMNKKKQKFISVLNSIAAIKPNNSIIPGSGYKFNQEGNQVKYSYDVEQIVSIDFDRNKVKGLIKKYNRFCDDISAKLDSIEINTEVNHVPAFDITDGFEDLMANNF